MLAACLLAPHLAGDGGRVLAAGNLGSEQPPPPGLEPCARMLRYGRVSFIANLDNLLQEVAVSYLSLGRKQRVGTEQLEDCYEQETLNYLYFQRELEVMIEGENLLQSLKIDNDLIRIISLDLWINRNESIEADASLVSEINELISAIQNDMQGQSMDGEHWLLLYESDMHGFMNVSIKNGGTASFFEEMRRLGISFYNP